MTNIHGLKLKIRDCKQALKEGLGNLGSKKFNRLNKRLETYKNILAKKRRELKENHKETKKRRFRTKK
jgi:hypothetical protein